MRPSTDKVSKEVKLTYLLSDISSVEARLVRLVRGRRCSSLHHLLLSLFSTEGEFVVLTSLLSLIGIQPLLVELLRGSFFSFLTEHDRRR